jgi:hypothetical protein
MSKIITFNKMESCITNTFYEGQSLEIDTIVASAKWPTIMYMFDICVYF